jgi:cytochrome c
MIGRIPAATITFIASVILGAGAASAGCAEDLTRIQLAAASASPDIRAAVDGLVSTAQARARANDASGCAGATMEALRLLGLPTLAPITLSTPVPGIDRQPQPPLPSAAGSQSAGGDKASPASHTTDGSSSATKAMGGAPSAAPPSSKSSSLPAARRQPGKTKSDQTDKADWFVVTSNVIGSDVTVQDRPAENIGSMKALVIDSTTRQTTLALIETGGVLGLGGKLIAVPFSAVQFFGRWDRPMIRANLATLQSGPRVTTTNVPDFVSNTNWRADLAKHFNVAPLPRPKTPASSSVVAVVARPEAAAATPGSEAAGDPAAGRTYVQGICGACHTFDQGGGTRVGPNLHGIVDRKIAGEPGFSYSAALKNHGGNWTAANLDGYLRGPQGFAPGTTMPFSGISSNNERRNVIAYLETLGNAQGGQK